jgi:hypothetical protein
MNLKRQIMLEYRKVYDGNPDVPFMHARDELAGKLGMEWAALGPIVKELENARWLHWKAQDLYKLSPRGLRVTGDAKELDLEFPEA